MTSLCHTALVSQDDDATGDHDDKAYDSERDKDELAYPPTNRRCYCG